MITLKKIFFLIAMVFILGCAQQKGFEYGISQINSINSKYNTTMETYPAGIEEINKMLAGMEQLKSMKLEIQQEPFEYIVDYRILNLEAERLFIEGQKYGSSGTTKEGFGCKSRPLILESVSYRNQSALKGFEAAALLAEFIEKYPDEAKSAGFSLKSILFLNASFYQVHQDARKDSSVINSLCPKTRVLELYQQEFRKKTSMSEDAITKLNYEEAVPIWKNLRGIK